MDAYKRIRQKSEYFSYTYNREFIKVSLGRIYYFESRNRVVYIYVAVVVRYKSKYIEKRIYNYTLFS